MYIPSKYKLIKFIKTNSLFLITLLAVLFLLILTSFRIHGSSIGIYHQYLFGGKDQSLLFGTPRLVRSDEWMVTTPLAIAQSNNNFSQFNPNSNNGQNLSVLLDIPTLHWTTIFKPYNWSFFVMPLENAFAFRWWIRGILLFFSAYLFFNAVTKNKFNSICGAAIILFSPYIQWWYSGSGPAVDTLTYGLFILFCLIKIFNFQNIFQLSLYASLLIFFSLCFIFWLYPPFQITIALFIIFFIIGYLLNNSSLITSKRIIPYITSLSITSIIIFLVVLTFYFSLKEIIDLTINTVYPGKRLATGGEYSIIRFFSGFFNIFFQNKQNEIPTLFINKSEGANFFFFFPFLIPLILYSIYQKWISQKKFDFIYLTIILYLVLTTSWVIIGLPNILSNTLFLNRVLENRMLLGIGLANTFICLYYLTFYDGLKQRTKIIYAFISAIIAAVIHIFISIVLQKNNYFYFKSDFFPIIGSNLYLLLICFIVFISVYLLIAKQTKLFLISLIFYSLISTIAINPLYQGLSPVVNSEITSQLLDLKTAYPETTWAVYDINLYLSHLLQANGFKTFSGVSMYPKVESLKILDPSNSYENIYNRYAHITFFKNNPDQISFELKTPDYFQIKIHPCRPELKELNIHFFVFNHRQAEKCLELVKSFNQLSTPIYVYRTKELIQ